MLHGWAWLVQLVRSLLSNDKVPSSILALLRFEHMCNLLFCLEANSAFYPFGVCK